MAETILQHWIFTEFGFPFLLLFFVVFAILERTELFGKGKKQVNALIAFVIGLIFVSVSSYVEMVNNLILFFTVSIITMFIGLLIWGFVTGETKFESDGMKKFFGIFVLVAMIIAVLWATGISVPVTNWLFKQDWSGTFWTNALFIVMISAAIAAILKSSVASK